MFTFQAAYAQLELSKKDKRRFNDVLILLNEKVNDYSKTINDAEDSQKFNFKPALKIYGDLLNKFKNPTTTKKSRFGVLNNTKYIDPNVDIFYETLVKPNVNNIEIETYLKYYLNNQIKIDFYIPDANFVSYNDSTLNWIYSHANSITIMSDGNYQPLRFYELKYLPWAAKQKSWPTKKELESNFELIQNTWPNNSSAWSKYSYWNYLQLNDKFQIFHFDGSYSNYFSREISLDGQIKVNNFSLNYYDTKENLNLSQTFLDLIAKTNKLFNKTILDLITDNASSYDPNKKNLVFIGSSLFRANPKSSSLSPFSFEDHPETLEEINEVFKAVLKKFPKKKFNYFFKLHPFYKAALAKTYVNMITNNFKSSLILDPETSWETMLIYDYSLLQKNKSVFFTKKANKTIDFKTQLWGFQGTTTAIMGTMNILESIYNDYELVKKQIDITNFPISNKFHLISRYTPYVSDQFSERKNRSALNNLYKYFIVGNRFYEINEFISSNDFIKKYNPKNLQQKTNKAV